MPIHKKWTDEMDAVLKQGVADPAGLSYPEIARIISAQFNIKMSRNACIGRAHRLKLQQTRPKPAPVVKEAKPRQRMVVVLKQTQQERPAIVETAEEAIAIIAQLHEGVEFMQLDTGVMCCAPLDKRGSDGLRMYCGQKQLRGSSYCPAHTRLFTTPRVETKRRY